MYSNRKGQLNARLIKNPNKDEYEKGKYLIYINQSPKYEQSSFKPVPVRAGKSKFYTLNNVVNLIFL